MIDRALTECRDWLIGLAPELATAGLQLLRHVEGWICPSDASAYAVRGPHIGIRDELRRRAEWPGSWGSYIVFREVPADRNTLRGVALHEAAHLLPAKVPVADDGEEPNAEQLAYHRKKLQTWAEGELEPDPWTGHEADFIANCLHLHRRAQLAGGDIPFSDMNFAGRNYGLSMPAVYQFELGCLPEAYQQLTFHEIQSEPLPKRFVTLFENDKRAFYLMRGIQ